MDGKDQTRRARSAQPQRRRSSRGSPKTPPSPTAAFGPACRCSSSSSPWTGWWRVSGSSWARPAAFARHAGSHRSARGQEERPRVAPCLGGHVSRHSWEFAMRTQPLAPALLAGMLLVSSSTYAQGAGGAGGAGGGAAGGGSGPPRLAAPPGLAAPRARPVGVSERWEPPPAREREPQRRAARRASRAMGPLAQRRRWPAIQPRVGPPAMRWPVLRRPRARTCPARTTLEARPRAELLARGPPERPETRPPIPGRTPRRAAAASLGACWASSAWRACLASGGVTAPEWKRPRPCRRAPDAAPPPTSRDHTRIGAETVLPQVNKDVHARPRL